VSPSGEPSSSPSAGPSASPSAVPSESPSGAPSSAPVSPCGGPNSSPSAGPSASPSGVPSETKELPTCTSLEGVWGPLGGSGDDLTLTPGCYTAAGDIRVAGILRLDGSGDEDPKWTFNIEAAFSTAADFLMLVHTDECSDAIVEWNVEGAIFLGGGSRTSGSMNAGSFITVGSGATCGDLNAGSFIAVGSGATCGDLNAGSFIGVGLGATCGDLNSDSGAITVGASATCGDLNTDSGAINVGASATCGDLNSDSGAITVGALTTCGDLNTDGVIRVGALTTCGPITAGGPVTVGEEARCGAITAVGNIDVGANAAVLYARTSAALTLGAGATVYLTVNHLTVNRNKFILDVAVAERYNGGKPVEMKVRATGSDNGADVKWLGSCDSFVCTNVFETGFNTVPPNANPTIITFDAKDDTFTFDLFAAVVAHPNAIAIGAKGPELNVKVINAPGSDPAGSEVTWYASGCDDTPAQGNCVDY
jgi:hypothetical protein